MPKGDRRTPKYPPAHSEDAQPQGIPSNLMTPALRLATEHWDWHEGFLREVCGLSDDQLKKLGKVARDYFAHGFKHGVESCRPPASYYAHAPSDRHKCEQLCKVASARSAHDY